MSALHLLLWTTLLVALHAVGRPLGAALFERFPDRGAGFTLPLSLCLAGLVAYWVGHARYRLVAPLAAGVALVGAGLLARRHAKRKGFLPERWPRRGPVLAFCLVGGVLLALRFVDPAVRAAGGESFLDYGLIHAVRRATTLPPEDFWFAGESVRYYYGGHLLVALLTTAAAVPPEFGFNLAQATVYGALAAAAYSLAAAVADETDAPRRLAGALAVLLVALGGNPATAGRLLFRLLPRELAARLGAPLYVGIRAPYSVAVQESHGGPFSYWSARYVVPGVPNVFPGWTFVNGDLRPHMVAAPFVLLAAALCFAYWRTPESARQRRRLLVFGALPAVGGLFGFTSTWALPTVCGLAFLTVAFADADPGSLFAGRLTVNRASRPVLDEARRYVLAGVATLPVALLSVALAAPYLLFHTARNEGVGFLPPGSAFAPFLLVYGGFFLAFALGLLPWLRARERAGRVAVGVAVTVAAVASAGVVVGFGAAALTLALICLAWGALVARRRLDAPVGFEMLLFLAGFGLVLVGEVAYARIWPFDPNAPRWNTVYKLSHQVWLLFGTGSAVALARALAVARVRWRGISLPARRQVVPALLALAVVVSAAAFPALAFGARLGSAAANPGTAAGTLSAMQYAERAHPDEAAAIRWVHREVEGQPTMVTQHGNIMYNWWDHGAAAPSSLTGVPTVLGWRHEMGYRGKAAYEERMRDVGLIYEGSWPTVFALVEKYDVAYVYVGPYERKAYDVNDFGERPRFEVAFREGNVTVYEVRN